MEKIDANFYFCETLRKTNSKKTKFFAKDQKTKTKRPIFLPKRPNDQDQKDQKIITEIIKIIELFAKTGLFDAQDSILLRKKRVSVRNQMQFSIKKRPKDQDQLKNSQKDQKTKTKDQKWSLVFQQSKSWSQTCQRFNEGFIIIFSITLWIN